MTAAQNRDFTAFLIKLVRMGLAPAACTANPHGFAMRAPTICIRTKLPPDCAILPRRCDFRTFAQIICENRCALSQI